MEKVINLEYELLILENDFLEICLLKTVISYLFSKKPWGHPGPPSPSRVCVGCVGCVWRVGVYIIGDAIVQ